MTPEELKFFTENKDKIFDLIRAVDQHEDIRMQVGPGNVIGYPHLVPDYLRAHDIMSRLSQFLRNEARMGVFNSGPLDDHKDILPRFGFNQMIPTSC